ncbi:MAG: response regulator [Myxococcota bacterium]
MAEKIILAEDNQAMREALAEALTSQRGYEVVQVGNGADAEAAALAGANLLVLDLLLPKKQGFQVAEAVRAAGKDIPIIMITGVYKDAKQIKDAKDRLGVKEYLIKPIDAGLFLNVVDAALGKATARSGAAASSTTTERAAEPMPATGSTMDIPAGALIFRAQAERHSGVLDLAGEPDRMRLFFYRGVLVFAQSNRQGRNLAAELVRRGMMSDDAMTLVLEEMAKSSTGLFKALSTLELCDEASAKEAYKALAPQICADAAGFVGRFKWTAGETFTKILPVVNSPTLPALMEGLKNVPPQVAEKLLEKKKTQRMNRGPNFDRLNPSVEAALGPDVSRAINGRARLGQIVEAAQGADARASRLRQAYALLCLQAAVASEGDAAGAPAAAEVSSPNLSTPPPPSAPARTVSGPSIPVPNIPLPTINEAPRAAPAPRGGVSVMPAPPAPAASRPAPPPAARPANTAGWAPEMKALMAEVDQRFASQKDWTHYEVLGITDKDDLGTLKKAYFALAGKFHADKFSGVDLGDAKERVDAVFARISEAYDVLSKPDKRAEYEAEQKLKAAGATTNLGAIFEAESKFTKAEQLLDRGDFISANKLLDQALELDPKELYRAYKAYVGFMAGGRNKAQAPAALKEIDELSKQVAIPRAVEFMGFIHKATENYLEARRCFQAMLGVQGANRIVATRELELIKKKLEEAQDAAKKGGGMLGKLFKS